jgi:GDP-mannose 6-dehydrogenase
LIGKGLTLRVCDPDVALGQLVGRNRAYIDERLPHLAQLMDPDWEALASAADVVIVAKRFAEPSRLAATLRSNQLVVDLVGIDALTSARRPWAADPREVAPLAEARH